MKRCNRCDKLKPLTEYYNCKHSKDGLMWKCKQCDNKQTTSKKKSIPPGVYMIKNLITGDCYIGKSERPYSRRSAHFSEYSKFTTSTNLKLYNAMQQYGRQHFVFGIIEHCSRSKLCKVEQQYIKLYNPAYNH